METRLSLDMTEQPDDLSCGPSCLSAVYRYFGDDYPVQDIIRELPLVRGGGTVPVLLGLHALGRGYSVRMYSYELDLFDPTWFFLSQEEISHKLSEQASVKGDQKFLQVTQAYIEYLEHGGELCFEDLTAALVRRYLKRGVPLLAGLSATYLYRECREVEERDDDIRGLPVGHFVILCGYEKEKRSVLVADPYLDNPLEGRHFYEVSIDRLVCAILLGILTYDSCLVAVEPRRKRRKGH